MRRDPRPIAVHAKEARQAHKPWGLGGRAAHMLALLDVAQSIRDEAAVVRAHYLQVPAVRVAVVQQVYQRQHRPARHILLARENEGVRSDLHGSAQLRC